jgi:hypothetical protein
MYIISGVRHPKSNLVVPLILCTVVYNIRGTSVVLKVLRDIVNPIENG